MPENYTLYFRLSPRAPNYIVSNLGNYIIEHLDKWFSTFLEHVPPNHL